MKKTLSVLLSMGLLLQPLSVCASRTGPSEDMFYSGSCETDKEVKAQPVGRQCIFDYTFTISETTNVEVEIKSDDESLYWEIMDSNFDIVAINRTSLLTDITLKPGEYTLRIQTPDPFEFIIKTGVESKIPDWSDIDWPDIDDILPSQPDDSNTEVDSGTSDDTTAVVSGYDWKKEDGKWRLLKDGEYVKNNWAQVEGVWYWLDEDGIMKTGWLQQGDAWYFLKSSGAMAASEWVTNNGYWYYVTSSGRMASSRWIQKPGTTDWYYVGASGQMLANRWMTLNGKSYYLKADGKMAANEYIQGYYVNANGEWVK